MGHGRLIMTVSIIICTRNRADSLKLTLESIGKAIVPPGWNVELLIVDNGSTDHTGEVVSAARLSNVCLRYVNEPTTGLGYARNTGLRETSGQIILFTDDDVRVPLDWIEGMCGPVLDGKADAVSGGVAFPSDLAFALARPPFSSRKGWFASTEELDRKSPTSMVGANMAFHRRVLDRIPGFDAELGAGALGFHEETLFSWQLLAAGYNLIGRFDVVVEHHFDTGRLTRKGIIDSAQKMGRSRAFVFHHWEHQKSRLVLPRLALCQLCRLWMRCSEWMGKNADGVVPERVLQQEQNLSFYQEYIAQSKRRHKYPLRGLAPDLARPIGLDQGQVKARS
jgi:glycosyltransferase involved in cell wall biosynthesis